jgi:hypothetical protein
LLLSIEKKKNGMKRYKKFMSDKKREENVGIFLEV